MGMPRGLAKLTYVANTMQAWEDWHKLVAQAVAAGIDADEIDALAPGSQDGWRKIDRRIAQLRALLEAHDPQK